MERWERTEEQAVLQVNQRVSHAERRGTVRFLGSLEVITGHADIWAGVEWDQERPGLHDGVLQGKRFFQTRPNSASFILEKKLSRGITVHEAIQQKYGTTTDMNIGVSFGQKNVVAVGWEKVIKQVSEFDRLPNVDLSGMDVNGCDVVDLCTVIPNIESLTLGRSLISSWSTVRKMIGELRRLKTLNLSDNRLEIDSVEPVSCTVRQLVLRQNSLVWDDVCRIIDLFPALEEIFLPENHIATLSFNPILKKRKISVLDLDSQIAPLTDWNEVCKLGEIQSLRVLQLSGNHFRRISISDKSTLFPALVHLTLKLNEIDNWHSVNELNKLPRLENLKIFPNPILETVSSETARQWVIAKIAGLKVLNQSQVTPAERRDAELDYLRRHGAEWLSIVNSDPVDAKRKETFLVEHPRYPIILEKLGPLEAGEVQPASVKQLKDSLIKVTLQFEERKEEKKIPLTISVLKLKRLAERIFQIAEAERICYMTPGKPDTKYMLDDDQKDIAHYDIKSGDTILIQ